MTRVYVVVILLALLVAAVLALSMLLESGTPDIDYAIIEPAGVETRDDATAAQPDEAPARVQVASAPVRVGSLKVHVLTRDLAPVPGVRVAIHPPKTDWRVGARWRASGSDGVVVIVDVPPGRYAVVTDRFSPKDEDFVSIVAGEQAEASITVGAENVVSGRVTDQAGNAVAGAAVWAAPASNIGQDLAIYDYTDETGVFRIEYDWEVLVVGARKAGFAQSKALVVNGQLQRVTEGVNLVLGGAGGGVRGRVVGEDGQPVENAIVRVGVGPVDRFAPLAGVAEPPPLEVRTDDKGSFEVSGVALGEQVMGVRAQGYSPWSGTCLVDSMKVEHPVIRLARAAGLSGIVKDENGQAIKGCFVSLLEPEQLAYMWGRTDGAGFYCLPDAPAGEFEVEFKALNYLVKAHQVSCIAGKKNWCEIVLEKGRVLKGVVLDQNDRPVGQAVVVGLNTSGIQFNYSISGADGSFEIVGCQEDTCRVQVEKPGFERKLAVCALDAAEPIVVRVVSHGPKSALVKGAVIDAGAMGVGGAQVTLSRASNIRPQQVSRSATSVGRGEFEIGPVAPGTYQIVVEPPGRPRILIENIQLAASEVKNLGELRAHEGGRLHFEYAEGSAAGASISLYDLEGRWVSDCSIGAVSDMLQPGEHMFRVHGQEVAEMMSTAMVHAGGISKVVVAAQKGKACEIVFHRNAGGPEETFKISVDPANGVGRSRVRFWAERQERLVEKKVLGPGEYTVRIERDGVRREHKITVGDDASPQVLPINWR